MDQILCGTLYLNAEFISYELKKNKDTIMGIYNYGKLYKKSISPTPLSGHIVAFSPRTK